MEGKLIWKKGMSFDVLNRNIESKIDVSIEQGGDNYGPTPKELVLNGIAGCSGVDVVSLLKKMRCMPEKFSIDAMAEKTDTMPSFFKSVHLIFHFNDQNKIETDKVIKSVIKSMTKYCGVSYMITKCCKITFDVDVNGTIVHSGESVFEDVG